MATAKANMAAADVSLKGIQKLFSLSTALGFTTTVTVGTGAAAIRVNTPTEQFDYLSVDEALLAITAQADKTRADAAAKIAAIDAAKSAAS